MVRPGVSRRRHGRERGVTLIELLATIALMATGVVGMLGLFSTIEIGVSGTGDDAQLVALVRQAGDLLKSESVAYVPCTASDGTAPTELTSYQTAVQALVTLPNPTYKVFVTGVQQAQLSGSSHTVAGVQNLALEPINGCSAGPASGPDFGVQQITFKVSSTHSSLTRIVYKRWN